MERTLIGNLRQKIGEVVKVQGWLHTLRDQKKIQFLILRDRTGLCQVAHWKENDPGLAEVISALGVESAVTVTGKVIDNPVVKLGGLEMQLESLAVENNAEIPLPFEPFGDALPALDFRMDWRFLDLRRKENLLLFQVQTELLAAMRDYWLQNDFIEINTPKLMGSPSESGAELFEVPYFETKAYLAQSPQFYKQMAMAAGFERVFEIGPVFRADPSFTSRHMTEFTSIDMEMSWIDSHEDVMAFEENMLRYTYQRVAEKYGDVIQEQMNFELRVPEVPFPRLPMAQAIEVLKQRGYQLPPDKKGDIDPGGEREIAAYIKETYDHDFVFLTDWSINVRPFYHMRYEDAPELTRGFDLIANGLEITTGAQREHRYEVLKAQALEKGLGLDPIQFYLDFFRYGCPSHGGLAIGLSRLAMVMLGLPNIREVVYLFRGPNRLHP
ncbi:MAG: aspartate--tRNA(Asn) ligase [Anaerolineae bacterium]|nr:aspartate--tRNA(Asn) ligase [Anaerolineae bacterium]